MVKDKNYKGVDVSQFDPDELTLYKYYQEWMDFSYERLRFFFEEFIKLNYIDK